MKRVLTLTVLLVATLILGCSTFDSGMAALQAGNYDQAISDFTTDMIIGNGNSVRYFYRGLAYHYKRDYSRAIADYETALQLHPDTNIANNARSHLALAKQRQPPSQQSGGQATNTARTNTTTPNQRTQTQPAAPRPAAPQPPPTPSSPYFTGDGGRKISLGIGTPKSQGLTADQAYLPTLVQGVLVDSISKYSGVQVLDRVSLDRVIAETLDPTFEDNFDIVRLGHVTQVGNWLTGNIIRTSSGFTLQLNITDTTPNAVTVASYTGTTTVADFDNHSAIRRAALALLEGMGVALTDRGKTELAQASSQQTVQAQTALSRGIVTQRQGKEDEALGYFTQAVTIDPVLPEARTRGAQTALAKGVVAENDGKGLVALNYYTQASMFNPTLPEVATRFSRLADSIQGTRLAEKFDWLRAFAQTGGSYIFEISADENIPAQTLSFSGKRNITLLLRGRGANRNLNNEFTIDSGVTLILDNNITLQKNIFINSGGTMIMNNGSTCTNGVYIDGGTFIMNGGTISGRTGVFERKAGIFTMNGGAITISGGGFSPVRMGEGGTFTMNNGTISNHNSNIHNGGGVYVINGTFNMNGGTISGNKSSYGGGVYVSSSTFNMSGGTISSNTIRGSGGGVHVEGGTFTMSGGTISDNVSGYGGGVYVTNGTFTMSGGIISGNTVSGGAGGGVFVNNGTFTIIDGEISGNTASSRDDGNGGGVCVFGTFTMNKGTIYGNTASNGAGGGVYASGNFTMRDGIISGNTARENGGGVWILNKGIFTKTGGTISGYIASDTNSNIVKNESGAVQNFKGHAVWAGSTETLLKIKEGTAGPRDNLSFDGSKTPPTASGAWDN